VKHTSFTLDWHLVALLLNVGAHDAEDTVEKLIALQRGISA